VEPRVPAVMGVMKAMKADIPRTSLAELGVETLPGLVRVGYRTAGIRPPVQVLEGDPAAAAAELVRRLREEAKVL
jgi:electron transfer flavoprotein alpha/beta subunit